MKTFHEPDDLETLYMHPEIMGEGVMYNTIAFAPLENRIMSMIVSKKFDSENISRFIHLFFTEEEVDTMIESLQETKRRWDKGKVVKC
jgi:hypothetical protein